MFTHAVVMHIVAGIHTHACAYRVKHMEEAPTLDGVRVSSGVPTTLLGAISLGLHATPALRFEDQEREGESKHDRTLDARGFNASSRQCAPTN